MLLLEIRSYIKDLSRKLKPFNAGMIRESFPKASLQQIHNAISFWWRKEGSKRYERVNCGTFTVYRPISNLPKKIVSNSNFYSWSFDGVYCELSQQNCNNCLVRLYGINRSNGCYQPESNEVLKQKNISIPVELIIKVKGVYHANL